MDPRLLLTLAALAACNRTTGDDDGKTDSDETDVSQETDVGDALDVDVTPDAPFPGQELTCAADTTNAVTYAWQVDGSDAGITTATVPGARVDAYQTWRCDATAGGVSGDDEVDVGEACTSLLVEDEAGWAQRAYDAAFDMADDSFTVEAWVWPAGAPPAAVRGGRIMTVVHHGDALGVTHDYSLEVLPPFGVVRFLTGNATCGVLTWSAMGRRFWHHLAGTYDASTATSTLWVDGVEVASCTGTVRPPIADGPLAVGARLANGTPRDFFEGYIDEVRISSVVRYRSAFTPPTYHHPDSDTAMLLHFSDITAATGATPDSTTSDSSDQSLDVTITGSTTLATDRSACDTLDPPATAIDSGWDTDTLDGTDRVGPRVWCDAASVNAADVFRSAGVPMADDPSAADLLWLRHDRPVNAPALRADQAINHLPGERAMTHKDQLARHLGDTAADFHPETYRLDDPAEREAWIRQLPAGDEPGEPWLIKPSALARGMGVRILDRFGGLVAAMGEAGRGPTVTVDGVTSTTIAQRYVDDLLLLDGHKSEVRVYWMIASLTPLRVYLWPEGTVRRTSQPWVRGAWQDAAVHVTNVFTQKQQPGFDPVAVRKWSFAQLDAYLARRGHAPGVLATQVLPAISRVLGRVVDATAHALPGDEPGHAFGLYGADILLDLELRPWLTEVQRNPSVSRGDAVKRAVVEPMLRDALAIAWDARQPGDVDPRGFRVVTTGARPWESS